MNLNSKITKKWTTYPIYFSREKYSDEIRSKYLTISTNYIPIIIKLSSKFSHRIAAPNFFRVDPIQGQIWQHGFEVARADARVKMAGPDRILAALDRIGIRFERFRLPLCCLALPRIPGPFSLDRDKPEVTRHRARGGHSIDCARSTRYVYIYISNLLLSNNKV